MVVQCTLLLLPREGHEAKIISGAEPMAGAMDMLLRLWAGDEGLTFYLLLMVNVYSGAREWPHHKHYLKFIDTSKLVKSGLWRREPEAKKMSRYPEVPEPP